MPKTWLGLVDDAAQRIGGEVIRGMGALMKPKGEPMTLKELLEEVDNLRLAIRIRTLDTVKVDLERYEKVLMPDLARRLKMAMDAMNDAIDSWNKGWDCKADPRHERMSDGITRLALATNEIADPPTIRDRIRETPGQPDKLGVDWATKPCPNCGVRMKRAEKSNGWFCARDFVFLPDDCA